MNSQVFGRYELLKLLATGSTSEIWLARQRGIGGFAKNLVVKRLLPRLMMDPVSVRRFLDEALIASRLNHPSIAQVYDFGEIDNKYYIAMEFIHGEDLGRIEHKTLSVKQRIARPLALRIVASVCEGLHYAHTLMDDTNRALKIVHRDICPQNILVTFAGAVKLVDFGIAKAVDRVSHTNTGEIMGNFAYMAPEHAAGKSLDRRADIFAIGIVLYELLTGVRPLKRESEGATLQAALECNIPPPSEVADVPAKLDAVVMKALAKAMDDRYRDARQFQIALEETLVAQRWVASSVQVSGLMETLFSDRLSEEKQLADQMLASNNESKSQASKLSALGAQIVPQSPRASSSPGVLPQSSYPSEAEPLVSWLHLSDIHFGYREASSRWDQKLVVDALRKDLVYLTQNKKSLLPSPDVILVTGDIAFSGIAPQYVEAKKWLVDVAQSIGLEKRHVFMVPGNHDVERAADERRLSVGWVTKSLRESTLLHLDNVLEDDEGRELLSQRLAHYLNFSADFAPACLNKESGPPSSRLSWSTLLVASKVLPVRLAGLNTAILAADENDRGKLWLGQKAIGEAFLQPPVREGELVLVLSHHPFRDGWLADESNAVGWLRQYAHIHLSGHIHESRTDGSRDHSGRNLISIAAGAVHDKHASAEPAGYGYNLAAVFREKDGLLRLRVWPRLWSARNKKFGVDTHNVPDGEESAEYSLFQMKSEDVKSEGPSIRSRRLIDVTG